MDPTLKAYLSGPKIIPINIIKIIKAIFMIIVVVLIELYIVKTMQERSYYNADQNLMTISDYLLRLVPIMILACFCVYWIFSIKKVAKTDSSRLILNSYISACAAASVVAELCCIFESLYNIGYFQ